MNKLRHWLAATSLLALAAGCGGQATVATNDASGSAPAESASSEMQATEQVSYADAWGPAIGAAMPLLDAPDQNGAQQTLASLAGDQGMLLFLNRSADW